MLNSFCIMLARCSPLCLRVKTCLCMRHVCESVREGFLHLIVFKWSLVTFLILRSRLWPWHQTNLLLFPHSSYFTTCVTNCCCSEAAIMSTSMAEAAFVNNDEDAALRSFSSPLPPPISTLHPPFSVSVSFAGEEE